jgi:hypothetical protein
MLMKSWKKIEKAISTRLPCNPYIFYLMFQNQFDPFILFVCYVTVVKKYCDCRDISLPFDDRIVEINFHRVIRGSPFY